MTESLWKNRTFTKMFTSFGISSLGDWFDMIAIMVLFSFQWKADPLLVALVPIMYAVPSIVLGQLAGVVADRTKKMPVMIATDLMRAALTVGLLYAPNPFWALPILFLRSTAGIFNTPAQQALLRTVVPEEKLMQANGVTGMMVQITKMLGPTLGSVLINLLSVRACLEVNAASFLLSGVILLTAGRVAEEEHTLKKLGDDGTKLAVAWKEGWQMLLSARTLLASTIFFLFGFFGLQIVDSQLGVLLREITPNRSELVGYVVAIVGLGTFIVGGVMTVKKNFKSYALPLGGGSLFIGLSFVGLGLFQLGNPTYWLLLLSLVTGIGAGLSVIGYSYMRQKETPAEMMGRITGITNSLTSVLVIVGPLLGSFLIKSVGVSSAFRISGYLLVGVGAVGLLFQRLIWGRRQTLLVREDGVAGGAK